MSISPEKTAAVTKTRRRSGWNWLNLLLLLLAIVAVGLFVKAEMQRRTTAKQLATTADELQKVKSSTASNGQEVAKAVLEKATKLIDIPLQPEPTVATITDVEKLRQTNEFYKNAENGDHLIITEKRAILLSAKRNIILDVVPVATDPNTPAAANVSPAPSSPAAASTAPAPVASPGPASVAPIPATPVP